MQRSETYAYWLAAQQGVVCPACQESTSAPDEGDQVPPFNSRNSSLQALQKRLSILEQQAVPSLQRALEATRATIHSQEFQASLAALQHVTEALAQQHASCSATAAMRSLGWQLWLGIVAVAGHAQQLLSGADVAALLLSRRLLLQRDPFELRSEGQM
ncbi:hypothetical protein WJX74_008292 [Apatococcus lobatus]|uniref:Uncharacterized protein n=1 Tax=Apatococcus lobatus TaxID=904363 RepID=A0AAW1Q9X0_9CHLO